MMFQIIYVGAWMILLLGFGFWIGWNIGFKHGYYAVMDKYNLRGKA